MTPPPATTTGHFTLAVDHARIQAAADRLGRLAGLVADEGERLSDVFGRVYSWQGATRDSTQAEATALHGHVKEFPALLDAAAKALTALATAAQEAEDAVRRMNVQWDDAQDTYRSAVTAADTAYATDARGADPSLSPAIQKGVLDRAGADRTAARARASANLSFEQDLVTKAYHGAVATLEAAARAASATLAASTAVKLPQACYAPGTDIGIDEVVAAFGDLRLTARRAAENWDDYASPEAAAAAGRDAAKRLDGSTGTKLDPELVAELERGATNPAFARALYAELGPQKLLWLPWAWATIETRQYGFGAIDVFSGDDAARAAVEAQHAKLADLLGTTFTTLSNDATVGPQLAAQLAGSAVDDHGTAFGLSVILSNAKPGTNQQVARDLATRIFDADGGGKDGWLFWHTQGDGGGSSPLQLMGSTKWYDPMVGVSHVLSLDPASAQQWLSEPGSTKGADRITVLAKRDWTADSGDAFGGLLLSATSPADHGPQGSPGWTSAKLLAETLTAWRDKDGSFSIPSGARDSVGEILARRIDDVAVGTGQTSADTGTIAARLLVGDTLLGTTPDWGVSLSGQDVRGLLTEVLRDEDAFKSLLGATAAHQNQQFEAIIAHGRAAGLPWEDVEKQIGNVLEANTRLLATVGGIGLDTQVADGRAADARAKLLVDFAKTAIGWYEIPYVKDLTGLTKDVVDELIDRGKDKAAGMFETDLAGKAEDRVDAALEAASHTLLVDVVTNLAVEGYFAPGGELADLAPDKVLGLRPDQSFFTDGRPIAWTDMTQSQREAFVQWVDSPAMGEAVTLPKLAIDAAWAKGLSDAHALG